MTGDDDNMILGVMCQVRDEDDAPMGTFSTDAENLQPIECTNEDDTLTHSERINMDSVSFMWTAPADDAGDLTVT